MSDESETGPATAPYGDLSPARRRRLLLRSLLRSALTVALLVALYALVPLEGPVDLARVVVPAVGLVVFLVVVVAQVRAVVRSDHPWLRALEGLACAVPLFLLLFAVTYYLFAREVAGSFNEPLDRVDALYFAVTVFATVGFGDIVPTTGAARVLTTVQMVADLVVIGVIVKALLGAVQVGRRRQRGADRSGG
ncbi:potassium channel family protein [Streptomyces sp. NPDC092296]|uniref:potassium channel family protein n=1 Tax=Streptomyces sp. NPDC092296 TaxID=3366012 RepID=UPI00381414B7